MKAVTSEQMSEIDLRAQTEYGISQSFLMENAGKAVAEEILLDIGDGKSVSIAILCGKGNNGGDGLAAALFLSSSPACKISLYLASLEMKDGAAMENLRKVQAAGLDVFPLSAFDPFSVDQDVVVDALFGTGFRGDLSGECAEICAGLSSGRVKVYAVDTPSGLNCTTGTASPFTPKACKTITFGLPKTGFFRNDGPRACGEIIVKDIGFPKQLLEEYLAKQ